MSVNKLENSRIFTPNSGIIDKTKIMWYNNKKYGGNSLIYIILLYLFTFLFGATIGSAVKCFIDRRENIKTWFTGRSKCTSCGKILKWYELIPFFGFIVLRGRCSKCKSKIPISCFLYECVMGLVFLCVTAIVVGVG